MEFAGLPCLRSARNFAEFSFIQCDEAGARCDKLIIRDKTTLEEIRKKDVLLDGIIDYGKLKYNRTFYNDHETTPAGLEQYAEELVSRFS